MRSVTEAQAREYMHIILNTGIQLQVDLSNFFIPRPIKPKIDNIEKLEADLYLLIKLREQIINRMENEGLEK